MTDYPTVNPYLTIKGASDALAFYGRAFGATEAHRMPAEDGKRLMHAEMNINGSVVMLSDEFPEYTGENCAPVSAPTAANPPPVAIVLHFKSPGEVDGTYARAIGAGCTKLNAPEDTFWNARFAGVTDPFGHRWMLNAPLPAKS